MLKIYNSLTRQKETFIPIDHQNVLMYVCGMTVYDYCHIGHARSLIAFDMITRYLRFSGYNLTFVRNITDIDDKIISRANEKGLSIHELTHQFITAMEEDCVALNVLKPDHEPRATDYIPGMIEMIQSLMDKGMAYQADNNDVYYRVRKFAEYGKLSNQKIDDLRAGERISIDHYKEDPLDFVLWKSSKENEPFWASPFGNGRPGWHIECSVMSLANLGASFDIHGGGMDLKFPHHECEIAQSEGSLNQPMAKYWMHNGFINIDGEKMSKSLNNFFTIRDITAQYPAEVLRFFILNANYRTHINYSEESIQQAGNGLRRLYTALHNATPHESYIFDPSHELIIRFKEAMDDDFNSPLAISLLYECATELNRNPSSLHYHILLALGDILGILQQDPKQFLQGSNHELDFDIEALIIKRNEARAHKDWAESDRIRDDLKEKGIILEDKDGKTTWRNL